MCKLSVIIVSDRPAATAACAVHWQGRVLLLLITAIAPAVIIVIPTIRRSSPIKCGCCGATAGADGPPAALRKDTARWLLCPAKVLG